jgi:hypothetical protein
MPGTLKIGIMRETRNPADRRVPFRPPQIVAHEEIYPNIYTLTITCIPDKSAFTL